MVPERGALLADFGERFHGWENQDERMSGAQTDVFASMMSLFIDDVTLFTTMITLLLLREGFGTQSTQVVQLLNLQGEVEFQYSSNTSWALYFHRKDCNCVTVNILQIKTKKKKKNQNLPRWWVSVAYLASSSLNNWNNWNTSNLRWTGKV